MPEDQYELVKDALLKHIREVFEEIEEGLVRSHEEKFAMLEDSLNNASDVDEIKVAFDQWYTDHCDELEFEYEVNELWDNALSNAEVDF